MLNDKNYNQPNENQPDEPLDITFIEEPHVVNLMNEYVCALEEIQNESDRQGNMFAERLFLSTQIEESHQDSIREICRRFLSSVGMVLRDEIPRTLPRAERRQARELTIDWSGPDMIACWSELAVNFDVENSLSYCAEHVAGADENLSKLLVAQYMEELEKGLIEIPRLTLVLRDLTKLTLRWKDAQIVL